MGAGDVDLFTSTAGWFGVGEVCDENYSFTCQHCQESWEKKALKPNFKGTHGAIK